MGRNEEAKQMIKWASEIPITFRSEEKEHAEIEEIIASLWLTDIYNMYGKVQNAWAKYRW